MYETEQNGLQQTAQRLKDEISAVREEGESVDRLMKLLNNQRTMVMHIGIMILMA